MSIHISLAQMTSHLACLSSKTSSLVGFSIEEDQNCANPNWIVFDSIEIVLTGITSTGFTEMTDQLNNQ